MKKISELVKNLEYRVIREGKENWQDIEVKDLVFDSRKVTEGSLFACEDGTVYDGIDFLDMAREKGAVVAIMDKEPKQFPDGLCMLMVNDVLDAESRIASAFYDKALSGVQMIGMTGTNGKTTTSTLMHHIFTESGKMACLIGTNENRIGLEHVPATHTTPYPFELYPLFKQMNEKGADTIVMEVSSHALAQHRVSEVHYHIGMFTNLTEDHLDYHKTMDAYLAAKCQLFFQSDIGLINGDDDACPVILSTKACPFLTYGLGENCDYRAENMSMDENGLEYDWLFKGNKLGRISYPVPGRFNVYNTLLAASASHLAGIDQDVIVRALSVDVTRVAGRFETFRSGDGVTAVVDYAHTPDGLENVLQTANEFARGRVITVFGCGGDRDPLKRPIMGEIAGRLSDFCIITSDNPRTEDPESIIDQIEPGVKKTDCAYIRNSDRKEAIKAAIEMAKDGDVVMVAGKGHEDYQIIGREKLHLDDREEVRKALALRD